MSKLGESLLAGRKLTLAVLSCEVVHASNSFGDTATELISLSCAVTAARDCRSVLLLFLPSRRPFKSQSCKK